MKRILVIRGGAIGDFVLTLPAIKLLRDNFPGAELEILGYKHIAALAENRFYADAVRSIEDSALAGFFAKDAELDLGLSVYFGGFDLVVSYLFDPEKIFERNLIQCGVSRYLACPPKVGGSDHASKQLARPLEQLNLSLGEPAAVLFPSKIDRVFGKEFHEGMTRPVLALHPGSGSESKNWPLESWLSLSQWLLEEGRFGRLLFVGGEADQQQLVALRTNLRSENVQFAESLPLPCLAALLQECALFVGHDSGISHIAAAVGTASLLLFGPTDPEVWAPANRNVTIARAPNEQLKELPLEFVKQAMMPFLPNRSQQGAVSS